jgi:hypothetical protein
MTRASGLGRKGQLGVFLAVFFAVLVGDGREVPWSDAKQIHQVAEAIAFRGALDVPVQTGLVREGKNYATHPIVASAIHLPGAVIQRVVGGQDHRARAFTSHLGPALAAGVAALYFLRLLLLLGLSPLGASLATVLMSFGTMVAVYARYPHPEIVETACFVAFFYHLLASTMRPGVREALLVGLWAGLLLNTKEIFVLSLPGAIAYVAASRWRELGPRRIAALVGWIGLGLVPAAIVMAWYNHARTGALTGFGRPPGAAARDLFVEPMWLGFWGLFFSPNKSLFIFNPPVALSLLALPRALRWRKDWLWALLLTAAPVVMVYCRSVFGSGAWGWGPRHLVFLVPLLLVPAAHLLDDALAARRTALLGAVAAACLVGLSVQVLGSMLYWDHPNRMAQEARTRWLGSPNRGGALTPESGGRCDPCYEDHLPLQWIAAFQPVALNYWMARHVLAKSPFEVAEKDAPWHRYTTLRLDVRDAYARARIDWWFNDYQRAPHRLPGRVLLGVVVAGLLAGIALWSAGVRRATRRDG